MKSDIQKEIENIDIYYKKLKIEEEKILTFTLPYEESTRTLIRYKKIDKTDLKYPRKYTDIKKKSL